MRGEGGQGQGQEFVFGDGARVAAVVEGGGGGVPAPGGEDARAA